MKMFFFFNFNLNICILLVSCNIIKEEMSSPYKIFNGCKEIINNYGYSGDTRVLYDIRTEDLHTMANLLIEYLYSQYTHTVVSYSNCLEYSKEILFKFANMIMLIQDSHDFPTLLNVSCIHLQKPAKQVLIGVLNPGCRDACVQEIANVAQKYLLINVIIVTMDVPLKQIRYFNYKPNITNCTGVNIKSLDDISKDITHVDTKVNFCNCPLVFGTMQIPPYMDFIKKWPKVEGIEVKMLNYLQKKFTFKIVLTFLFNKTHNKYDNFNLFKEEISIILSPISINQKRLTTAKFLVYDVSQVVMVLPVRRRITAYKKIIKPFQENLWFVLGILYILLNVYNLVSARNNKFSRNLDIEAVFLGMTALLHPSKPHSQWLFLTFLIFTFLLRNIYLAGLYKFIVSDFYETGPKSIKDVLDAGVQVGGSKAFESTLEDIMNSSGSRQPAQYWTNLNLINEKLYNITEGEEYGFVQMRGVVFHLLTEMNKTITDIYVVPQILRSYPISVSFSKNFPYEEEFSRVVRQMVDIGLMMKWVRDAQLTLIKKPSHGFRESFDALDIEHVSGALVFLFSGYILSTFAFVIELLWYKLKIEHFYV